MAIAIGMPVLTSVSPRNLFAGEDGRVDYLRDIKPIFIERCSACHGGLEQNAGLRLDTAAAMIRGGDGGAAVAPGNANESFLVKVLNGDAGLTMPPEGQGTPPSEAELALIVRWIDQGAKAPPGERPQPNPATYWSYQPPSKVEVPVVENSGWVQNPIDAFVAAQHEARGLKPQPPAKPRVLLRRLFLDLVGYPPTRAELAKFIANPTDQAYEDVVDELLARPQYGERWGRHWMDIWRYSDWYGRRPNNEIRYSQRHIWRWRDWIIRSLNSDKGYDQMLTEMVAGDEVAPTDNNILAATGFLGRNWYKFDKNTWLFETVEQTSRGLMAMTMRCCRCHDHKYDPITQQEYYEFRAFFEPHGFRTDAIVPHAKIQVDNGKSKVLTDGLSRAYDKTPDVPTYLFQRGDDRNPDTKNPLRPNVPASLGTDGLEIEPVALPVESYMPQLSAHAVRRAAQQAQAAIDQAKTKRDETQQKIARLQEQLTGLEKRDVARESKPFIRDNFETLDTDTWKVVSGRWSVKDGKLTESQVTSFATLVSTKNLSENLLKRGGQAHFVPKTPQNEPVPGGFRTGSKEHPRNFVARARYRKLKPGTYRSVGFSFDYVNSGKDSQDVYTARADGRPHGSVQAFHRQKGKQTYPREAIKPADIEVGQWIDLEFQVRETQLTIKLNGEVKLEYALPLERVAGKFAIWVHQGSAEFESLEILPLTPSVADLESAIAATKHQRRIAELSVELAEAGWEFQRRQIAAERLRLGVDSGDHQTAALEAHRRELQVPLLKARLEAAKAERQLQLVDSETNRKKLADAKAKADQATSRLATADGAYSRLKAKYPAKSTGRRLALARWLTRPNHPRTSRVAVNHIWVRHFGEAIVPSVDNFGLSGKLPSHPRLLDWLAKQLVRNGWRMKHLHKLIVMSNTYRLSSRPGQAESVNHQNDPENVFLWRANSRRMEAEVLRDSMLAVCGQMDCTLGGPDIDESQGQSSRRRSLYFRTTPDNQMQMLSLFDQANPDECYRRKTSVIPQQALALMNSRLAIGLSRKLAAKLSKPLAGAAQDNADRRFIQAAFETILSRAPTEEEITDCQQFLDGTAKLFQNRTALAAFPAASAKATVAASKNPMQRSRESLVHVLFNHNEFVTIR